MNKIYQGLFIEHLAGQEIISSQSSALSKLNFWVREKKTSMAEVDFIFPFESKLIPVEIKSGATGKLKSLHQFMDQASHSMAVRFHGGGYSISKVTTPAGKKFILLNLPYYLCSQIENYLPWLSGKMK